MRVLVVLGLVMTFAMPAHAEDALPFVAHNAGLGVAGFWTRDSWYGSYRAESTIYLGPLGIAIDGGVSPSGYARGGETLGGGLRYVLSAWTVSMPAQVRARAWLQLGLRWEHWNAGDSMTSVNGAVYGAAIGYDAVERRGFGAQYFARVERGRVVANETDANTFVVGVMLLHDFSPN